MHTLSRIVLVLGVVAAAAACPGVGDIDRTQPEKVKKSIFFNDDGTPAEFYYRTTVIDVPATNGVTFIGDQSDTERVVFEVTENFLFVYRSYGWLQNEGVVAGNQGDGYTRPGVPYDGAPIAAFRIQSHFDVKRQYNPATGEQTNVIYEDQSDRPWYQREYMRVDWSNNSIADFRFDSPVAFQTPASVSVPEEDGLGDNKDRPVITPEYIDVVDKYNVGPEAVDLSYYGYGMVPECYFSPSLFKDCFGGTIKVRASFRKVAKSDYVPLDYDDLRFQKFGFFRSERFAYDDQYDVVEQSQVKRANRWNIWKDAASCYNPEADLPYSACKPDQLRTIVYYLNEDFPKDPPELRQMALHNADQWNKLLTDAVKASTGFTDADIGDHRMFTLCANNPVQEGDPAECGAVGTNPQIGDLRYSMYYYIPNYQAAPPLGYGPAATDPLTGEIIQANAFYYGYAGAWIAARTRDEVKLQLGLLSPDDISDGALARGAVSAAQEAARQSTQAHAMPANVGEKARRMAQNLHIKEQGARLRAQIASGYALVDKRPGRKQALLNSGAGGLLLTDEMKQVFGPALLDENVDPEHADDVMTARLFDNDALFNHYRMRTERFLKPEAGGCILRAEDVFDDALLGLTATVKSKFYDTTTSPPSLKAGFTEDDVFNFVLANTLGDTMLHEMGHTMGLRHNFAGSTDALNFGPRYWELRGQLVPPGGTRPVPEWEISGNLVDLQQSALDQGMRDEQTSSVMDYESTYGTRVALGAYDFAAIKYAYGDIVEVFDSPDITPDKAKLLQPGELHYTYYPEVVSKAGSYGERAAALYQRHDVNFRKAGGDGSVEVPYSFCSDEYRGASATCAIWDVGADNFERTVYETNHYRNYSIFNNFKRERLTYGLDIFGYLSRVYRYNLTYVLNQYKNWVDDELIIRSGKPCLAVDLAADPSGGIVTESTDRFAADQCGLAGFLGSVETINLLGEILQEPDVGCYERLKPGCYDTVVGNANDSTPPTDPDIRLVDADPDSATCASYVPSQPSPTDTQSSRRVLLSVRATTPYAHVTDTTSCDGVATLRDSVTDDDLMEQPLDLAYRPGGARPANTLYDRDRYGYYFYDKPLTIGSWWDKWLAVKALGDPDTNFIGVDASSDTRAFLISLNTLFGNDINNLIGGAVTDNVGVYGPVVNTAGNDVEILPVLDINTGGAIDRTQIGRATINPDQQYTFRLLAMFNAAYNGQYTDRFEFGESLNIGNAYNLTNTDIPDDVRSDPARYAEVTDPVTGIKWFALNQQRSDAPGLYSIGYQFIRDIKDRYYVGGADGPGTELQPGFQGQFEFMPRQDLDIVRIMSSAAGVFGYADVWSGDLQF